MFAFLHAADLHLDSPLRGLDRYEGALTDRIRGATREAFDNLVKLAIAEKVSFVLIACDPKTPQLSLSVTQNRVGPE